VDPGPHPGPLEVLHVSSVLQMSPGSSEMDQNLSDSLALLGGPGLDRLLGGWLLETLQMRLSSSVVPEFWTGLKQPENELEERGRAWVLLTAFRTLLDRLEPFLGKWTNYNRVQSRLAGSSVPTSPPPPPPPQAVCRSWARGRTRAAAACAVPGSGASRTGPSP